MGIDRGRKKENRREQRREHQKVKGKVDWRTSRNIKGKGGQD
jgi:hypothetical protein